MPAGRRAGERAAVPAGGRAGGRAAVPAGGGAGGQQSRRAGGRRAGEPAGPQTSKLRGAPPTRHEAWTKTCPFGPVAAHTSPDHVSPTANCGQKAPHRHRDRCHPHRVTQKQWPAPTTPRPPPARSGPPARAGSAGAPVGRGGPPDSRTANVQASRRTAYQTRGVDQNLPIWAGGRPRLPGPRVADRELWTKSAPRQRPQRHRPQRPTASRPVPPPPGHPETVARPDRSPAAAGASGPPALRWAGVGGPAAGPQTSKLRGAPPTRHEAWTKTCPFGPVAAHTSPDHVSPTANCGQKAPHRQRPTASAPHRQRPPPPATGATPTGSPRNSGPPRPLPGPQPARPMLPRGPASQSRRGWAQPPTVASGVRLSCSGRECWTPPGAPSRP